MATCRSLAGSIGLVLLLGSVACGEMLTLDTINASTGGSLTLDPINASNMGWYSQGPTGDCYHDPTIRSYVVGRSTLQGTNYVEEFRNFFVFNVSALSDAVSGAKLKLSRLLTSGGSETYNLHSVTTSPAILIAENYGACASDIFNDLGEGTSYGTCSVSASTETFVEIPLSPAFLSDAKTASKFIAIGGALAFNSGSEDEFLFGGNSARNTDAQLVLTLAPIPEPTAFTLLLMAAGSMLTWSYGWRFRVNR